MDYKIKRLGILIVILNFCSANSQYSIPYNLNDQPRTAYLYNKNENQMEKILLYNAKNYYDSLAEQKPNKQNQNNNYPLRNLNNYNPYIYNSNRSPSHPGEVYANNANYANYYSSKPNNKTPNNKFLLNNYRNYYNNPYLNYRAPKKYQGIYPPFSLNPLNNYPFKMVQKFPSTNSGYNIQQAQVPHHGVPAAVPQQIKPENQHAPKYTNTNPPYFPSVSEIPKVAINFIRQFVPNPLAVYPTPPTNDYRSTHPFTYLPGYTSPRPSLRPSSPRPIPQPPPTRTMFYVPVVKPGVESAIYRPINSNTEINREKIKHTEVTYHKHPKASIKNIHNLQTFENSKENDDDNDDDHDHDHEHDHDHDHRYHQDDDSDIVQNNNNEDDDEDEDNDEDDEESKPVGLVYRKKEVYTTYKPKSRKKKHRNQKANKRHDQSPDQEISSTAQSEKYKKDNGLNYNDEYYIKKGYKTSEDHDTYDEYEKGNNKDWENKNKGTGYDNDDSKTSNVNKEKKDLAEKYDEKKAHQKGSKTKGYHNVFHKDEYLKDHTFYDKLNKQGDFKKHGKEHKSYENDKAKVEKGEYEKGGHDEQHQKNGENHRRGKHENDEKKFRENHKHKKQYENEEKYGKKSSENGNHVKGSKKQR